MAAQVGLTPDQIDFYHHEGYLLVHELFDPGRLDLLRSDMCTLIDGLAHAAFEAGCLVKLFEDEPLERRLVSIAAAMDDPSDLLSQVNGKLRTPGMFQIFTEPALLDMVESIIGPEILAHPQFNIRAKLPNQDTSVVPWHQDLAYLQPDAEKTFMVNVWLPLVDATVENGCMEVIPSSHLTLVEHEERLGPGRNFRGVRTENLPQGDPVSCPLRVGDVLLIQHMTMHRSLPNTSDHIRWSLDLRYSDPAMPTGRDRVPGFIARSKTEPLSVSRDVEEWDYIVESGQQVVST